MPAVLACHKIFPALLEHPETEKCLEKVVHIHDPLYFKRFSLFHEFWANNLDNVDISYTDKSGGPHRRHQKPVVHSLVPQVHHEVIVGALVDIIYRESL